MVRDSGVKERNRGRKMTRKKKSEMAPLPPPNNVKRALLLALVAAVLHFGRCDSLTVVDNEGKREGMSNSRNCAMGIVGISFACRTNRIRQI